MVDINGVMALINTASEVVSKGNEMVRNPSLSRFVKPAVLSSRVFIDNSVVKEPIMTDTLKMLQGLYVAFIINAFQLNELVTDTKTIRDSLNLVATEGFDVDEFVDTSSKFAQMVGLESFVVALEANDGPTPPATFNSKEIEISNNLPVGKLVEITFNSGVGKDSVTRKITIMVRLTPYIVPDSLVKELIGLDTVETVKQRYIRWKAGEISFWSDLVLGFDKISQKQRVLKDDKEGVILGYIAQQLMKHEAATKRATHIARNAFKGNSGVDVAQNIANTIMIFSDQAVKEVKTRSGYNLYDPIDRHMYFLKTYSWMIVIINPLYEKVTLFIDGVDGGGEYTYDMMKIKKNGIEPMDLVKAMAAMALGKAPRF